MSLTIKQTLGFLMLSTFFLFSCQNSSNDATASKVLASNKQNITIDDILIVDYEGLKPFLNRSNDTTYVINFWATWCKPCIEELPYFLELDQAQKGTAFKMILVSLDFPKQIERKLVPYINEHNIRPQVIVLDDPNSNYWIDQINPEWSGAIPATIVYRNGKSEFYERSFESIDELEEIVEPFLN